MVVLTVGEAAEEWDMDGSLKCLENQNKKKLIENKTKNTATVVELERADSSGDRQRQWQWAKWHWVGWTRTGCKRLGNGGRWSHGWWGIGRRRHALQVAKCASRHVEGQKRAWRRMTRLLGMWLWGLDANIEVTTMLWQLAGNVDKKVTGTDNWNERLSQLILGNNCRLEGRHGQLQKNSYQKTVGVHWASSNIGLPCSCLSLGSKFHVESVKEELEWNQRTTELVECIQLSYKYL